MGCLHSVRDGRIRLCLAAFACAVGVACSGGVVASGDERIGIAVTSSSITIENNTGVTLARGEVAVIPQGIPRPYTLLLPRLSNGQKRTFALTGFKMSDGTPFRSDVASGRSVKVTATDTAGVAYEREVPFVTD